MFKHFRSYAILILFSHSFAWAVAPGVAGVASLIPGLGQGLNGNPLEGVGYFFSTVGLMSSGSSSIRQMGFTLWQYNMYDAYRDAKPAGGRIAQHNVFQNALAGFNPANIVDPIGAPIVAFGAVAGRRTGYPALRKPIKILEYDFVGMGEEGLFRGFLFPGFSDVFQSKWVGALVSSALFSYAHVINGASSRTSGALTFRFLGGLLFCWQLDRNRYDLRKNIFAHAWYDIFVDDGGPLKELRPRVEMKIWF